jgi:hypothetical protein
MPAGAIARLVTLWQQEQRIIDSLVAPSRRSTAHHMYCGPINDESVRSAAQAVTQYGDEPLPRHCRLGYDRYQTLNLCAYAVHGTIEIRQHQGTLNATKALAWVALGQALFARAIRTPSVTPAVGIRHLLDELESNVGLDSTIASYLMDRYEGFAGQRIAA